MKLIIVPIGATLGVIIMLAESIETTSKERSIVVTFPYALATVKETLRGPVVSNFSVHFDHSFV